jgi:hypothetical protein
VKTSIPAKIADVLFQIDPASFRRKAAANIMRVEMFS